MKLILTATSALLLTSFVQVATAATANQVSKLGISGWYDECDLVTADLTQSCIGNYVENDEPAALDPTGNTCYVNPLLPKNTSAVGVYWFGEQSDGGVYIYSILLVGNETTAAPRNCTSNGACSCDAFEEYCGDGGSGDGIGPGGSGPGCTFGPVNELGNFVGKECAVFVREATTYNDGLVGSCFVAGKLVDLTAVPTLSPSPTALPSPPTSDGRRQGATAFSHLLFSFMAIMAVVLISFV